MQLGLPLPGDLYDENGKMLLAKGQIPNSQSLLDKLIERGLYLDVSVFEACFGRSGSSSSKTAIQKKFDPFLLRRTMKLSLNRLLYGVTRGSANMAQILEFAADLQACAEADGEAMIAACLLDREEESRAAAHSLSCAILCALLAKRLDWPDACQRSVVSAALTMNIGMLDLQQRLSHQSTPLAPAQLEQVHAHPEAAVAALQSVAVDDLLWLETVRQHHEKATGKGYPRQLATPADEGQLLRLVDVFFARARGRSDHSPLPPRQIVGELFVEEGQGAYAALVTSMVKMLGIYPPGSFVKLASGELAVVFRRGATASTPVVASVTNAGGAPTMQPVRRDTSREAWGVVATIAPDKVSVGYDLGKLWVSDAKN